ncbi:hypothetical protein EW146_g10199, partial [Bondarzewia mesenterica]
HFHQSLPTHPNIVTLHQMLETSSYLLLLLKFVPGEDLFYFLEQARDHFDVDPSDDSVLSSSCTPLTPSILSSLYSAQLLSDTRLRLIASIFSQMCEAVAVCHDTSVFHRDIKPENFIVTDGWQTNGDGKRERSPKRLGFSCQTTRQWTGSKADHDGDDDDDGARNCRGDDGMSWTSDGEGQEYQLSAKRTYDGGYFPPQEVGPMGELPEYARELVVDPPASVGQQLDRRSFAFQAIGCSGDAITCPHGSTLWDRNGAASQTHHRDRIRLQPRRLDGSLMHKVSVVNTSFMYESAPMYVIDQLNFINCACIFQTTSIPSTKKSIRELLAKVTAAQPPDTLAMNKVMPFPLYPHAPFPESSSENVLSCVPGRFVVHAFDDSEVIHVEGDIDRLHDMEIIKTELRLKDIEWVQKSLENLKKSGRSLGSSSLADKAKKEEIATIKKVLKLLTEEKKDMRKGDWTNKEPSSSRRE